MNEILILAAIGALGGLIWHLSYSKGKVILPYWENGTIHLGFLFNLILGGIFGLLTPYGLGSIVKELFPSFPVINNPVTAFFAGLGSIVVLENFIEKVFGRKPPQGSDGIPFTPR